MVSEVKAVDSARYGLLFEHMKIVMMLLISCQYLLISRAFFITPNSNNKSIILFVYNQYVRVMVDFTYHLILCLVRKFLIVLNQPTE